MRRVLSVGVLIIAVFQLSPVLGQTTHIVIVGPDNGLVFSPDEIVITVGDTVLWEWEGFDIFGHNVVSDDGAFLSGPPVNPPACFEVTFDQIFLDENSVPGNLYGYHCEPHFVFGMVGTVQVVVPQEFIRGDCNGDGMINIADGIFILNQLFGGSPPVRSCDDACDTNDEGLKNIADAIYMFNFLFALGPPPPVPFPGCGFDPTADSLGCESFAACP